MPNGLGAIGLWFLIFAPCLPWTIMMCKDPHREVRRNDEGWEPFANNYWLDAFAIMTLVLSAFWTFGVVSCSPGVVLLYAFHYKPEDALRLGVKIGLGIVAVGGSAFIWWSRRRH